MRRLLYLGFVFAISAVALRIASAKNLYGMYSREKISNEQPRLKRRVYEIYEQVYLPNLLPDERRALTGMVIDTPLSGDPVIGYYSNYKVRTVTMPAVSLLFFEDLSTAFAWLSRNGYRLETLEEYLSMLKYKTPREFGDRYPSPLEALGIPRDALNDPMVNDLSLRIRNTGWAFILGHELGHIRYQHPFYNEASAEEAQANEEKADEFGLELMRRVSEIPMGGLLFFQSAIYYFENRADYEYLSDEQWQNYLTKTATHPLTAQRLRVLSEKLDAFAGDFARGQENPATAMATNKFIAGGFAEFAKFLDDPTLQRVMKAKVKNSPPSSLAPRRTRETLRDFQLH